MSMEKRKDSFEKSLREMAYKEFVVDLLDSRHSIEQMIDYKRSRRYASYQGFRNETFTPPAYLSGILPTTTTNATLEFSTVDIDGILSITDLTINTDDKRPVFIHKSPELDIVEVECGDEVQILDNDALETTLMSFLPERVRKKATIDQAVKALGLLSPEKDESSTFFGEDVGFFGEVRFSNLETFNDSVQVLEIIHRKAHVSGATIGTRLRITESILERMKLISSRHVSQSLDIHTAKTADPIITIEDIMNDDGRFVEVAVPTRNHIDDINAVLQLLKQARAGRTHQS